MESKRQEKITKLLQKELGDIFRIKSSVLDRSMITVTKVTITPDLKISKVYLSIFASPNKEATLEKVTDIAKEIRYEIGKRIKNQLRIVPEFRYYIDDSLDYIARIDDLLQND